ncbi:MAG: hypothetical protein J6J99_11245 [Oscillibacter sp.]|nr:hypothetical protein [Oscillibacter sp.]
MGTGVFWTAMPENIHFNKNEKTVDKAFGGWYTKSAKQRRLIASASPPAKGQRGQQRCYQTADEVVCCCADAMVWYPRFVIFGWRCFDHS